jgi:hypothetical protein
MNPSAFTRTPRTRAAAATVSIGAFRSAAPRAFQNSRTHTAG